LLVFFVLQFIALFLCSKALQTEAMMKQYNINGIRNHSLMNHVPAEVEACGFSSSSSLLLPPFLIQILCAV
jgi:hypothetical protein